MLNKTYDESKAQHQAERAHQRHISELRRQAKTGNTKAKKELDKLVPQRQINRRDKRAFGVRSSLRHGAKKRRAWNGYPGGKLG